MSERSHRHNPAAHKGRSLFSLIGHIQLLISLPPCLGSGGSRIAGSRRLPLFPRKGTGRERSFYIEKAHSARRFPSRTSRACSLPKQKTQRLCVSSRWVPILSTHNLKCLASARHLIERKLYSYQIARFKQTSQWRRKSWWCILPAALILWHAGSDVMGCRRPTGGVFTYVSSDRVTLRAFPVATPRGRSSSSHEGELHLSCYSMKVIPSVMALKFHSEIYSAFKLAMTQCFKFHSIDVKLARLISRWQVQFLRCKIKMGREVFKV